MTCWRSFSKLCKFLKRDNRSTWNILRNRKWSEFYKANPGIEYARWRPTQPALEAEDLKTAQAED